MPNDPPQRHEVIDRRAFKRVNRRRVLAMLREAGARTVLDLGCGTGQTVRYLLDAGFDAYGITLSPAEVEASALPDRLSVCDVQEPIDHPAAPFDAAVSIDCLEHLANPLAGLRNLNAVLGHGAPFICYIPPVKWTEYDDHVIVYTPRQMRWLLNLTGFRLVAREGRFRFGSRGMTYYTRKAADGQLTPGRRG